MVWSDHLETFFQSMFPPLSAPCGFGLANSKPKPWKPTRLNEETPF